MIHRQRIPDQGSPDPTAWLDPMTLYEESREREDDPVQVAILHGVSDSCQNGSAVEVGQSEMGRT